MTPPDINVVAALVSALLASAIGIVWYAPPVFGRFLPSETPASTPRFLAGIFAFFVIYVVLAEILRVTPEEAQGTLIAPLIVGISALVALPVIWERKPLQYALIHAGFLSAVLFGGALVIRMWPW